MGDADDLVLTGQAAELLGDAFGRLPPDAGVDFVEDQCFEAAAFAANGLQGQHNPGELSSGSDLAQGTQLFSRVGADEKFDIVQSCIAGLFPVQRGRRLALQADLEAGFFHAQQADFPLDFRFQSGRPLPAEPRKGPGLRLVI